MFKRSKKLQSEVEFLRARIKDLELQLKDAQDRVMSFCEQQFAHYMTKKQVAGEIQEPTFIDPLGQIQNMEAKTPDEEKEKAQAESQMMAILNH